MDICNLEFRLESLNFIEFYRSLSLLNKKIIVFT